MRRRALLLLLALGGAAHAALPRVVFQTPAASISALSLVAAPTALPPSASIFAGAVPALSASPAELSAQTPLLAATPSEPKAIDALRTDVALDDHLTASAPNASAENAAGTLEKMFDAAADLGANVDGPVLAAPAPAEPGQLLDRLLQHVRLENDGLPARRAALAHALSRILETPTGRELAERFVADGSLATVRFAAFEGTRIRMLEGRKTFHGYYAQAAWENNRVEVSLNLAYMEIDEEIRRQSLPHYLAHELFGHGTWFPRAARANVYPMFTRHELNEQYARLAQWLVDIELDQRFDDAGAPDYLRGPAAYLKDLKLRHSSYAASLSTAELARPRETLEERIQEAQAAREEALRRKSNRASWIAAMDQLVSARAVAESRLRTVRADITEAMLNDQFDAAMLDTAIAEMTSFVNQMNAQPNRELELYLRDVAAHPFFSNLQRETDELSRRLLERTRLTPSQPDERTPPPAEVPKYDRQGQITFDELADLWDRHNNRWWQ